MRRVALITDAQTPLGEELVRLYLAAGHCVAATRSNQERFETALVSEEDRLLLIDWNRTSPVSARNVLLAALNRFDALDEALLLYAPPPHQESLQELSHGAIERAVDTWIKGTLFLAKGLLETFAQRRAGSLALVQQLACSPPPLGAALQGAFRSTARSLAAGGTMAVSGAMAAGGTTRVRVDVFECRDEDPEAPGFAAFILRQLDAHGQKGSGRRYRFPRWTGRLQRLLGRARRPAST